MSGNSGGNCEDVARAGLVLTSVTDNATTSTVTLSSTAPATVSEGSTITYTATVSNAVTGTSLVLTRSNSQTITIAVGQTTGSVSYTVRSDDAYAQGTAALPAVSISGKGGGRVGKEGSTGAGVGQVKEKGETGTGALSFTEPAKGSEGSTIQDKGDG